jgi:coproporphyrinogen III oxidase-like Fe-S oxidoreductase
VFERYSFDLMYARPEQSLSAWRKELENAVKFSNGHMSLYQLTIERNTPFYMSHKQGDFSIPDEDLAADFYNLTQDVMAGAGLPAYEVSNHACAGQESRHNLIYWHYGDYIGIGPGAHGRLTIDGRKHATREHQAPEIWLQKVADSGSGAHPFDVLSPRDIFMEALMMGVRLVEGVSPSELERKSGLSWCAVLDEGRIQTLSAEGWLLLGSDNRLTLTREGMLRMNAIIPYIIKSVE